LRERLGPRRGAGLTREHGLLVQVGRDEVGEGEQLAQRGLGIGVEQPVAARRNHHGVEHHDRRLHAS
jgi:hypothetical protein